MTLRLALPLVAIFAFFVGCIASSPTQDANAGVSTSNIANLACPTGEAVVAFDPAGLPKCATPWIEASASASTPTPSPTPPAAKTISVSELSCTAGPGGNARFTVVSVSPGFAYSNLKTTDSTTPSTTFSVEPSSSSDIAAGDTLTLRASGTLACSDIVNFIDVASNNIVATITLHP